MAKYRIVEHRSFYHVEERGWWGWTCVPNTVSPTPEGAKNILLGRLGKNKNIVEYFDG